MKRSTLFASFALLALSGCASSPSGGPNTNTVAPNRLTVSMTLAQAVNNSNFYYFGFDDDGDTNTGPRAIVTEGSDSANGVITGGSRTGSNNSNPNAAIGLTVLVTYRGGQFSAFRRTAQQNGRETLDRIESAFTGSDGQSPTGVSGNRIFFTLDLDAFRTTNTSTGATPGRQYLFRHNSITPGDLAFDRLETNFVTTNQVIFDSQDNRIKPFDALGPNNGIGSERGLGANANVFQSFDIRQTRTGPAAYNETDVQPFPETTGDVFNPDGSLPDTTERGRLDISAFRLEVRRSR